MPEEATLIVYAPGIHTGGGAILLKLLLKEWMHAKENLHLFLDERMLSQCDKKIMTNQTVTIVSTGLWERLKAEAQLSKLATKATRVMCFSNIPPLFFLHGEVWVYFQNLLLLKPDIWKYFKGLQRLKFYVLRKLLYLFRSHGDQYCVQTHFTQRCLSDFLGTSHSVKVMVFHPKLTSKKDNIFIKPPCYDFIYPASDAPHKNHGNLIRAWCLLAEQGLFPHLCLTLEQDSALWGWIKAKKLVYALKITNVGTVPHEMMANYYGQSKALVYPSYVESYGLPLLESQDLKLPIVAAEADYVREVVTPNETFDPHSPRSIAKAVEKFIEEEERVAQ